MDASKLAEIEKAISDTIDGWVRETVKDRFINRPVGVPKRSLWDKFKQGVTNWFWGPNGEKENPYRWRNRFGDELGVSESFDPSFLTLNEYAEIRDVVDSLELNLEEAEQSDEKFGKLRLMTMIKSAANDLKGMLFNAVRNVILTAVPQRAEPGPESPPAVPQQPAKRLRPLKRRSQKKASQASPGSNADKASSSPKKTRAAANVASVSADNAKPKSAEAPLEDEEVGNAVLSSDAADETDTPATSSDASSNDKVSQPAGEDKGKIEAKNPELGGFFYAKDKQPVDFQRRIKKFLRTEKYKNYESGLERFWRSLMEEANNKRWSEDETRYDWAMNMVVGDKFLDEISKITGFAKGEVKKDMLDYLASLDS